MNRVQLTLHTMRTPDDAKTFHGRAMEMTQAMAESGPLGGKVSTPAGVGDSALLDHKQLGGVHIATLRFLKGKVAVRVQGWRKDAPAQDSATAVSMQVANKL